MKDIKLGTLFSILVTLCFVSASAEDTGQITTVTLLTQRGNFADAQGNSVPSGSLFGIVVDTTGNGFFTGQYGPFKESLNVESRPDSFLTLPGDVDTSVGLVYVGSTGTNGFIGGAMGIRHSIGGGIVDTGNKWGIIWFPGLRDGDTPGLGDSYGFYTNENLTVPLPRETINYEQYIREGVKTADYAIIPEPRAYAVILGAGVLIHATFWRRLKRK